MLFRCQLYHENSRTQPGFLVAINFYLSVGLTFRSLCVSPLSLQRGRSVAILCLRLSVQIITMPRVNFTQVLVDCSIRNKGRITIGVSAERVNAINCDASRYLQQWLQAFIRTTGWNNTHPCKLAPCKFSSSDFSSRSTVIYWKTPIPCTCSIELETVGWNFTSSSCDACRVRQIKRSIDLREFCTQTCVQNCTYELLGGSTTCYPFMK